MQHGIEVSGGRKGARLTTTNRSVTATDGRKGIKTGGRGATSYSRLTTTNRSVTATDG